MFSHPLPVNGAIVRGWKKMSKLGRLFAPRSKNAQDAPNRQDNIANTIDFDVLKGPPRLLHSHLLFSSIFIVLADVLFFKRSVAWPYWVVTSPLNCR